MRSGGRDDDLAAPVGVPDQPRRRPVARERGICSASITSSVRMWLSIIAQPTIRRPY